MVSISHPIYKNFSTNTVSNPIFVQEFSNYKAEPSQESIQPDIAIKRSWQEIAKNCALLFLQILIFPWGLYVAFKSILHRIVMLVALPAQYLFRSKIIDQMRVMIAKEKRPGYFIREVKLENNGIQYMGIMVGKESEIFNGKWALFACGNGTTAERSLIYGVQDPYIRAGFNLLIVNAPGVGGSEGVATIDRIGDAQEVAIRHLEETIKAKKIVLAGHSLGGAAIGLATLKHEFKKSIDYLIFRYMTFDRFSRIVGKIVGAWGGKVISWLDLEMDSVAASRKLQNEGIHEIVIQGGKDKLMENVTLLESLKNENLMENKTGVVIPHAEHNHLPHDFIAQEIQKWDQSTNPAVAV